MLSYGSAEQRLDEGIVIANPRPGVGQRDAKPGQHGEHSGDPIYRHALRSMPGDIDGQLPLPVPDRCPVALDELLAVED